MHSIDSFDIAAGDDDGGITHSLSLRCCWPNAVCGSVLVLCEKSLPQHSYFLPLIAAAAVSISLFPTYGLPPVLANMDNHA